MTRQVVLNALKGGISRLRTKGGADPSTLYDLVNGWVTQAGTSESRPGTENDAVLPAGTRGLRAFDGKLLVFSDSMKTVPPDYRCDILIHPTNDAATLRYIHFAAPFLGYPYVVAEWSDGAVFHYWLQDAERWQALTNYSLNAAILPTVDNGFAYAAERLSSPGQIWAAGAPRAVGDRVEPTVPNGFEYVAIEVYGDNPASGTVEPAWPTVAGATVNEDVDGSTVTPAPAAGNPSTTPPQEVIDRYANPGGSRPGGTTTQAQ